MVMAANGLICIGTESGRILVFDFKQTLRCICGDSSSGAHRMFTFPQLLELIVYLQKRPLER
jgi:hypothetical protein